MVGARIDGPIKPGDPVPGQAANPIACVGPHCPDRDRHRGHEVRRHLRRRRRAHQARRAADRRARKREGPPRRRRALGARQDHRRADRDGRGGLADARPARDGHAALHRRAHLLRAVRDGDQRPRPPGDLADRLAGRHRHRHVAHQGAHPRRARRPHPRARSTRTRSCSSPASRASRPPRTSRRSAAAARTPPRSRSPPRMGAEVCEIYTDVAGVFSADPRIVPDARKLPGRLLRGDARDVGVGRRRAAAALGRVRPQPRRAHPLPLLVHRGARVPSSSEKRRRWNAP